MKIGIIGSGKMGGNLARLWSNAGHEIFLTSNNLKETKNLADTFERKVSVGDTEFVISRSDTILLAVPYEAISEISKYRESFARKIIMDCINPLTADALGMLIGFDTSAGEHVAELFPEAKVVKVFNVIASPVLEKDDVRINAEAPSVFFCGDDESAKSVVSHLISDIGFEPVDSGSLKNARYLEPMAELLIQLAFGGLGANIAFKLLK